MKNTTRFIVIALIGGVLLAALALMPGAATITTAQNTIPTITPSPVPSPTMVPTPDAEAIAEAAHYTVTRAEMVSDYPNGVEYIFQATSDAGEIDRVQLAFWAMDGTVESTSMEYDASLDAWVYYDILYMPPWYEINYRFRATDTAGNTIEIDDLVTEYSDKSRLWLRRENDDVIVLYMGGDESLINQVFRSTASAMDNLAAAYGFHLDYKPYVVIVPNQIDFFEWQEYPDEQLAGQTRSAIGHTIQTMQWGSSYLIDSVIPHELTHIVQGFISEARDIPAWFIEGEATYFEPLQDYDYEQRVRDIATHPDFPTLQGDISLEFLGPDGRNRLAYDVGYTFIKYWLDNYGMESHIAFWQAQVTMNFEEALEFATGKTLVELETDWRSWIGAQGAAPTLIPSPTLLPLPTAPGGN